MFDLSIKTGEKLQTETLVKMLFKMKPTTVNNLYRIITIIISLAMLIDAVAGKAN